MGTKKKDKITKGTSQAVLLSILIHIGLFLLAGTLVVFTVIRQKEVEFEPPKAVERPKMKLKKPKVRTRSSSRPKTTARITTKSQRSAMPTLDVPEMGGLGGDVGGMPGGFDLLGEMPEITSFGSSQSIGNDLVGTFYDLKRSRNGSLIPYSRDHFYDEVNEFVRKGFKPAHLSRYYRSPNKLFATAIMVPPILSCMGPIAYGEPAVPGCLFLIHYTGEIVYPEDITFRFRGSSGDVLLVGIDGEVVINACWQSASEYFRYWPFWQSSSGVSGQHRLGFQNAVVGDWITLKAGEPRKMDVLMGENPGGGFGASLVVEVEGVEYERNPRGAPVFPVFKTAELTLDQLDAIYIDLVEGEACLTNGPVFADYGSSTQHSVPATREPVTAPEPEPEPDRKPLSQRSTWTMADGSELEATFIALIGNQAVFKNNRKRLRKIDLSLLSETNRQDIILASPPEFDFDLAKGSFTRPPLDPGPLIPWRPPTLIDYVFTAKVRQRTPRSYDHELIMEYFVFGEEIDGDNYILLDRNSTVFTPNRENDRSCKLSGDKILLNDYTSFYGQRRGEKYGGYVITLTDIRGEVIGYKATHKWLYERLDKLKQLPTGRHFDKKCNRVFPPRPERPY